MANIEPGVISQVTNLGYLFRKNINGYEICFGEILKEGFSKGFVNGFGGKVGDNIKGETPEEALIREAHEEFYIDVKEYYKKAIINFYSFSKDVPDVICHVYFIKTWNGIPKESNEVRPIWFDINKLPYGKMWPSDRHWLKDLLKLNSTDYFNNSDYCIYNVLSSLDWKTILSIKRYDMNHKNEVSLNIK